MEVTNYENEISQDYRLNYRLDKACKKEVLSLCPTACDLSSGSDLGIPDKVRVHVQTVCSPAGLTITPSFGFLEESALMF